MTHFSIPLRGEWDYIPNEFCLYNWHDGQSAFLPGVWDGSRFGYASYHLKVEGLVPGVSYGLRVPYQATSFILYLDGKPAARNGKIGRTRDDSKPQYHSEVIYFNAHAGSVEVVLQVSNYFHRRGGPFQTILFGDSLSVRQTNYWLNFIDWAFVIVFLSMSIYQLSFWLIRRDRSILLMAAVLFFIGVNGIFDTSNALIFSLMPNLSWELYEKFCYFSSYATGMLLLLFLHEMYGGISSRLVKILIAPTFVIFLLVVLTPAYIFTSLNHFFQMYEFLTIAVCFAVIVLAIISRKPSSMHMLFAFIIISGCILSAAYFSNNRLSLGTFLPLGFLNYYNPKLSITYLPINAISWVLLLFLINIFSMAYFLKYPSVTGRKIRGENLQNNPELQTCMAEYGLSTREIEVCIQMLQGKTNKEILNSLCISLSTVKTHISRIFKKTGASSRTDLFFLFHKKN